MMATTRSSRRVGLPHARARWSECLPSALGLNKLS